MMELAANNELFVLLLLLSFALIAATGGDL